MPWPPQRLEGRFRGGRCAEFECRKNKGWNTLEREGKHSDQYPIAPQPPHHDDRHAVLVVLGAPRAAHHLLGVVVGGVWLGGLGLRLVRGLLGGGHGWVGVVG